MGIFDAFIDDRDVRLIGVEAGGDGIAPGEHAARFAGGSAGVLQGTRTLRAAGRGRQHRADAFDLGRPRLRRGRSRARVAARRSAAPNTRGSTTRRRSRRFSGWRARRASCRRSSRRTRSRTRAGSRRTLAADAIAAGQPVGARRQGRAERAEGARPLRTEARVMSRLADDVRAAPRRAARPGWSPTSPPAIRICARTARDPASRSIAAAPTCSRSACRSPIRWPTAR